MKHILILQSLDKQCCDAHSIWTNLESLKMCLAKEFGISEQRMMDNDIFIKGGPEQEKTL